MINISNDHNDDFYDNEANYAEVDLHKDEQKPTLC